MELFAIGNYDAMYLAGLIADESKMSKKDIGEWAAKAKSSGISEYTVAWVAAESALPELSVKVSKQSFLKNFSAFFFSPFYQ